MTHDVQAPFVPRRGRIAGGIAAAGSLVVFTGVALIAPGPKEGGFALADRVMLIGLGALIAAFLFRYALIRAVPGPEALAIRNLLVSRVVPWPEIESITFDGGDPWPRLHLSDGDDVAVMAIQRSDGPRSRTEASRLAGLIEGHRGRTSRSTP